MVSAVEVSAAKPWDGDSSWLLMRSPSVLMIFHPPKAVPKPIASAHADDHPGLDDRRRLGICDRYQHGDDAHGFLGIVRAMGEGHGSRR